MAKICCSISNELLQTIIISDVIHIKWFTETHLTNQKLAWINFGTSIKLVLKLTNHWTVKQQNPYKMAHAINSI